MSIFGDLFQNYFRTNQINQIEDEVAANSVGMSDGEQIISPLNRYDYVSNIGTGDPSPEYTGSFIQLDEQFESKALRIRKYREMSMFPEIAEGLDMIADESIQTNSDGEIAKLQIDNDNFTQTEQATLTKEFEYLMDRVFMFKENGFELFRQWLIEGEMFLELVVPRDAKRLRDKGLIGFKKLSAAYTRPNYVNGNLIKNYVQKVPNSDKPIIFPRNEVVYSYYAHGRSVNDVVGFLEPSVRVYNQLKQIEDMLVVYRLTRAPEKRVFNVEVFNQTTGQADQFLKKIIQKYKNSIGYDETTGTLTGGRNRQSLTEDFWFVKRNGQGTNVETLNSSMSLGELDDVNIFMNKLRTSMKLPKSRFEDRNKTYTSTAELDYENLKFNNFKDRLLNKFKYMFLDAFIQHLKFKGYKSKFLDKKSYNMMFTSTQYYKEYREVALKMQKVEMLASLSPYTPEVDQLFANKTILEDFLGLDPEFLKRNEINKKNEAENRGEGEADDLGALGDLAAGRPPSGESGGGDEPEIDLPDEEPDTGGEEPPEVDDTDLDGATFDQGN